MSAKKKKTAKILNILLAILVAAIGYLYIGVLDIFHLQSDAVPSEHFRVSLLDTGNSDCTVLLTPEGKTMVIDAGETDDFETISSFLNNNGVRTIDVLVLTHPHADHIGSASELIEHFPVSQIVMSPAEHTSKLFENLLDAIAKKEIPVTYAAPLVSLKLGSAAVEFLSPAEDYGDLNNMSAVCLVTYGDTRFLFTGDIESNVERDLVTAFGASMQCDVLKVPHHGSDTSSSEEFLSCVRPRFALIPCGKDNEYGHPSPQTLARLDDVGTQIFRTDLLGTITCISDGVNISIAYEENAGNV